MRDRIQFDAQGKLDRLWNRMVGHRYRHFRGHIYKVDGLAVHTETSEVMVIYHSVVNPMRVWCRPLDMFVSPVDHEKYPNVHQCARFELLPDADEDPEGSEPCE